MLSEDRPGNALALLRRQLPAPLAALWRASLRGDFVLGLAIAAVVGAMTFRHFAGSLVFSVDSAAYFSQANEFLRHPPGFFTFAANYAESLGNMYWPVNFALLPEFRAGFIGGHVDPAWFYLSASLLIFAANYALASVLGLGRIAGFYALALLALTLPYTTTWSYTIMFSWLDPKWLPLLYWEPATLVAFLLIGRHRLWVSALAIAAFVALCLWSIAAVPKIAFVTLGVAAVYAAVFTLGARTRGEAALKLAAGAILLAVCLAGPIDFLRGVYGYTTNAVTVPWVSIRNPGDVARTVWALLDTPNFLLQLSLDRTILGVPLFIGGVLGGLVALLKWRSARDVALFGATTLLLIAESTRFFYGTVILGAIYPSIALLSVFLLVEAGNRLAALLPFGAALRAYAPALAWGAVVLGAGALVVLCYRSPLYAGISYPPGAPPVVDALERDIGFGASQPFRGRFVNLAGRPTDPAQPNKFTLAYQLLASEVSFSASIANDLTFAGLSYYEIPTPQENNRFSTPRALAFFGRFLTSPGAEQTLDYRIVSRPDPKFLGLIGVRYVLADQPPAGFLPVSVPLPGKGLGLYRLEEINLGQYSPTKVLPRDTFAAALDAMAAPEFDPRRDLVTDGALPGAGGLVPARGVEITRLGDGLRIRAQSDGRSVLVLPFEYSRCLVADRGAAAPIRIFRADFLLTGVLLDRTLDTQLRFRLGPFTNAGCRQQDVADGRREGLDYDGFTAYRQQHPELFDYPWLH